MNLTEEQKLTDWNQEQSEIYLVNAIVLIIYIFIAIVGNSLVIIVYKFKMKDNVDDRYFIPWLALFDLLACTSRCSFEFARKRHPVNFRGTLLCKLCWIPINITAFSSMILLFVIALHRYLKVCRPFGRQMTLFWKRLSLVLTLLVAMSLSMALNVYNEEVPVYNKKINVTGYVCEIDINGIDGGFIVFIFFATVFVLIIMCGLAAFNILIGRSIYRQLHFRMRSTRSVPQAYLTPHRDLHVSTFSGDAAETANSKRESQQKSVEAEERKKQLISHRFSYMFMMIAIAFILSYVPQFIILFLSLSSDNFWVNKNTTELVVMTLFREMNVLNNIVNPFIYGYYDKRFRENSLRLISCKRILHQSNIVFPENNR